MLMNKMPEFSEMNGALFSRWFKEFISEIPEGSYVVMDNGKTWEDFVSFYFTFTKNLYGKADHISYKVVVVVGVRSCETFLRPPLPLERCATNIKKCQLSVAWFSIRVVGQNIILRN